MAGVHRSWFGEYRHLYRPRTAAWIRHGMSVKQEEMEEARGGRAVLAEQLEGLLEEHGASAWICPAATGPAPMGLESTGDPIMNLPWTYAGMPAASIPVMEFSGGLPGGLQIIGRRSEDRELALLCADLHARLDPAPSS